MARAIIHLPDKFIFSTKIQVRIGDINYGQHLGNDALLAIVHESRLQFLQHNGFSEKNVDRCGIIMVDAVIIYKSQAYYGDILKIEIAANDLGKRTCDLIYKITNITSGREVARVKTCIAFFDYHKGMTVAVPEKFKKILTSS